MDHTPLPARWRVTGLLVAMVLLAGDSARPQDASFQTVVNARECQVLLSVGDRVYGGLTDGGVVVWDAANPSSYERWTTAEGLAGHRVSDLVYSGSHLWVLSTGAGMTRVTLGAGGPQFRQYANFGGTVVTGMAATTRGTSEVVYYGLRDGGVGQIVGGLTGTVYTQEEHALVSNDVTSLAFFQGDLWVGTHQGVSQFAGNVFTTRNDGLPSTSIETLFAAGDTLLLAENSSGGLAHWDTTAQVWNALPDLGGRVLSFAVVAGRVWALREGFGVDNRLWRLDGGAWAGMTLPEPQTRAIAAGQGELWVAGTRVETGMAGNNRLGRAFLARGLPDAWSSNWLIDELLFSAVDGMAFAGDGSLWLGSRDGVAVSRRNPAGTWDHIYELASADNDSVGLLGYGPNVLSILVRPDGEVWFSQFDGVGGLVRIRPSAGGGLTDADFDHLIRSNCPLSSRRVVRLVQHAEGPLLILSDDFGVDILIDPQRWRDPSQWVHLPTSSPGLSGITVRDALITRRDQIWFTVEETGLVRWDINGTASADAPLTWSNLNDDQWGAPLPGFAGVSQDLRFIRGLALARDGTIWAGGSSGLVRFQPTDSGGGSFLAAYGAKTDNFTAGLLTAGVRDLEMDANGDLWVGTDGGLNRLRQRDTSTLIDAYTDVTSYVSPSLNLATLYSPEIIVGLPESPVYELTADPSGTRMLVGAVGGAALISIETLAQAGGAPLDDLYLYPNPLGLTQPLALKLGGVPADAFEGRTASVRIYNLDGQIVHRVERLGEGETVWDGTNLEGTLVSAGMYLVKVELGDQTVVKSLAVVR